MRNHQRVLHLAHNELRRACRGLALFALFAPLGLGSALSGQSQLYSFLGDKLNMRLGGSLAAAGDVNADGWPDLMLGAVQANQWRGLVQIRSGRDGRILHLLNGPKAKSVFGLSLAGLGDIDGDKSGDFAIGSQSSPQGEVSLYSGKTGRVIKVLKNGMVGGLFGSSLAVLEDRKRNGAPVLVIGAPLEQINQNLIPGAVYVVSTKTGKTIFKLLANGHLDRYGFSVAKVADVNKDGYEDFAVGAFQAGKGPGEGGYVELRSGKDGKLIHLWKGDSQGDTLGFSLASVGDIDGDGIDDVLAGADSALGGKGYARLYSGLTGKVIRTQIGTKWNQSYFGTAVSGAGDLDGDGRADYLISEPRPPYGGQSGRVYLYSGKTGNRLRVFSAKGIAAGYGYTLAQTGDVNRDGNPDFMLLAVSSGQAFVRVLSGKPLALTADKYEVSLSSGGAQNFLLAAGATHARKFYWMLGTMSGVRPGIRVGGMPVPINPDAYTGFLIGNPHSLVISAFGQLDSQGIAKAQFKLPPGQPASLAGRVLDHAFVVLRFPPLAFDSASLSVPLVLVK